jgi:N-methylhydantoinase A/oxoprolinase/acetone carboxylase beta subunit
VLNAQMAEGIRLVSVQRGIDPRGFTLVPLGGAGGLHAVALARALGMRRILVPRLPGVLAACGLLAAPIEHEVSASFTRPVAATTALEIEEALAALDARCAALMRQEGLEPGGYEVRHSADLCYIGQSHTLEVPLELARLQDGLAPAYEDFLRTHDAVYGHGERVPARFVNLRSVATARSGEAPLAEAPRADADARAVAKGRRSIVAGKRGLRLLADVYERGDLPSGAEFAGPAIVEQFDSTTLIEPGWGAKVTTGGTLILEPLDAS